MAKGYRWMKSNQWHQLVQNLIPKLMLDVELRLEEYQILGPILWDLVSQSALPSDVADSQSECLDLNFVIRFLLRNLLRNGTIYWLMFLFLGSLGFLLRLKIRTQEQFLFENA